MQQKVQKISFFPFFVLSITAISDNAKIHFQKTEKRTIRSFLYANDIVRSDLLQPAACLGESFAGNVVFALHQTQGCAYPKRRWKQRGFRDSLKTLSQIRFAPKSRECNFIRHIFVLNLKRFFFFFISIYLFLFHNTFKYFRRICNRDDWTYCVEYNIG